MANEKIKNDLLYKIFKTETKTTFLDGIRIEKQINIQIKPYILLSQLGKLSVNEIKALLNKEELDLEKIFKLNQEKNYSYFKWKAFLISNENKPAIYEAKKLFFPIKMENIFDYLEIFLNNELRYKKPYDFDKEDSYFYHLASLDLEITILQKYE